MKMMGVGKTLASALRQACVQKSQQQQQQQQDSQSMVDMRTLSDNDQRGHGPDEEEGCSLGKEDDDGDKEEEEEEEEEAEDEQDKADEEEHVFENAASSPIQISPPTIG